MKTISKILREHMENQELDSLINQRILSDSQFNNFNEYLEYWKELNSQYEHAIQEIIGDRDPKMVLKLLEKYFSI